MPWHRRRKLTTDKEGRLRERMSEETGSDEPMDSRPDAERHVGERLRRLRPISSFAPIANLGTSSAVNLSAATASQESIINNSTVIEILVHLLCRERETDPAKRDLLFRAISKVVEQCNASLYLPLHSVPQLQDYRSNLLGKFEILFEQARTQIASQGNHLPLASFSRSPNPLTQLALTSSSHHLVDDRYTREFEEVSVLGRGGFGLVTKVRHKLDGQTYAVKIIPIWKDDLKTLNTLLREAQALAGLGHPHIVRYHSTWTQFYCRSGSRGRHQTAQDTSEESSSSLPSRPTVSSRMPRPGVKIKELSRSGEESSEFSDGIEFRDYSTDEIQLNMSSHLHVNQKFAKSSTLHVSTHHQTTESYSKLSHHFQNYIMELKSCTSTDADEPLPPLEATDDESESEMSEASFTDRSENFTHGSQFTSDYSNKKPVAIYQPQRRFTQRKKSNIAQMTLFIQMGLCSQSLHEWLQKRNELHSASQDGSVVNAVNRNQCLIYFKQILQAVEYIHSNDIIHRDIKPANIFFSQDGKTLQLGDFGLARQLAKTMIFEDPPSGVIPNPPSLTPITEFALNTSGVGTPIYAAPELKAGGSYGVKSDMHNLGIILLELFQPFQTVSERIQVIEALKKDRVIDQEILSTWPDIASWVLKLTEFDPRERPSASSVLTSSLCAHIPPDDGRTNANLVQRSNSPAMKNATTYSRHQMAAEGTVDVACSYQSEEFCLHKEESHSLSFGALIPSRQQSPQHAETSRFHNQAIVKLREEKAALMEQVAQLQRQIEKLEAGGVKGSPKSKDPPSS